MLDMCDVPQNPDVEYYKRLARLSEERAHEIRRIAALERARLEERLLEQEPALKAYSEELERLGRNCESLSDSREHLSRRCKRLEINAERVKENSHRLKAELAATRAQLKTLRQAEARIARSRAHRLADVYVRHAMGSSPLARALRCIRPIARVLNRVRRELMSR